MENLIKVNKLSGDQKASMKSRVSTALLMVVFGVIIITLLVFSDETNGSTIKDAWCWWIPKSIHHYVSFSCAIIAIVILSCLNIFVAKELDNCFLKTNNKKIITIITICLLSIELIPAILWLVPNYFPEIIKGDKDKQVLFVGLFLGVGILFSIISFVVCILLMKHSKNKTKFNKVLFPFVVVGIAIAFGLVYYLAIIRYWTTLFLLLLVVCGCDIMAYFSGVLFGKHKMAPNVSPKKSWEGAIIGTILAAGLFVLAIYLFSLINKNVAPIPSTNVACQFFGIQFLGIKDWFYDWQWWVAIAILAIVLCVATIFGDLFFSLLKRKNNIKDFSNILKAHGGLLDRMDSFLSVSLFFGLITLIISIITSIYNKDVNTIFPNF